MYIYKFLYFRNLFRVRTRSKKKGRQNWAVIGVRKEVGIKRENESGLESPCKKSGRK